MARDALPDLPAHTLPCRYGGSFRFINSLGLYGFCHTAFGISNRPWDALSKSRAAAPGGPSRFVGGIN